MCVCVPNCDSTPHAALVSAVVPGTVSEGLNSWSEALMAGLAV